jgi:methanogenic corrinoid protein MtbC1
MGLQPNQDSAPKHGEGNRRSASGDTTGTGQAQAGHPITPSEYMKLARVIQSEIIPRLFLTLSPDPQELPERTFHPPIAAPAAKLGEQEVSRFVSLLLSDDDTAAYARACRLLADGVSVDTIFLDLLAPAARRLGTLWETDECSFFEVTRSLGQMQVLLRRFGQDLGFTVDAATLGFRVLLASLPGEQHTFGISMVEEFFREHGWQTDRLVEPDLKALRKAVASDWYSIVGLSVSQDLVGDELKDLIAELRKAAPNPNTLFMVGGHFFNEHPEQVLLVGADGTGVDAQAAFARFQSLLGLS